MHSFHFFIFYELNKAPCGKDAMVRFLGVPAAVNVLMVRSFCHLVLVQLVKVVWLSVTVVR